MSRLKTRREFLRLSAMAGAGTLLAACAPVAPQVVEKVVTKEVEKEVVVTATPEVKKPVKLVSWFADRRTINIMTQEMMKSQFEVRYPHITVEVQFVPEGEILAKMATAYAAGQAPDITALDETQLPGFLKQGFVHAIPEEVLDVPKEMGKRTGDFYKIEPGPAYYAVPNGNMPCVVYYNADLLEKLGYKPEDIPVKWDDFIAWAKELTVWEGDEIKQWGFTFVGTPWFWDSVGYQQGGWLFKNSKESMLDDPINVEAYQFTLDLLDVHKLDFRTAPLTPQDRVGQGLAATGVQFGFGFGFLENQYPTTRFGTMPLPTFTGEPIYGRSSDDLGFCVTTQREDPEEIESVWTLYRFLVGPDYQRRYVVLRGLQPSLLALNQEEQFTENNPKWRGVALMTKPGNYHADGVWPAEVTPLMHQDAWERIVNQGEPVETVLADHKAKIDKILAEHDLPLLNGKEGWKAEWEQPEM
jgi:ABC-type glycerol-3-phosphate transport system substrate-binding protein